MKKKEYTISKSHKIPCKWCPFQSVDDATNLFKYFPKLTDWACPIVEYVYKFDLDDIFLPMSKLKRLATFKAKFGQMMATCVLLIAKKCSGQDFDDMPVLTQLM